MTSLNRYLWSFPLTIHLTYALSTIPSLPGTIGYASALAGNTGMFVLQWILTILFANASLLTIGLWLHRLDVRLLSVPKKEYWLSSPERRSHLVQILQDLIFRILLLCNISLLAVYQTVYQGNVAAPVLWIPAPLLLSGLMGFPMIMAVLLLLQVFLRLHRADIG